MSELLSKYETDQSKMVFVTVELACDVEVKKNRLEISAFFPSMTLYQIILSFVR